MPENKKQGRKSDITTAKSVEAASAKRKAAAEKTASTRKTLKTNFFIQHEGKEIEDKELIARVKEIWVSGMGNKIKDMETLTIYAKPEEESVYYVINENVTGRIDF